MVIVWQLQRNYFYEYSQTGAYCVLSATIWLSINFSTFSVINTFAHSGRLYFFSPFLIFLCPFLWSHYSHNNPIKQKHHKIRTLELNSKVKCLNVRQSICSGRRVVRDGCWFQMKVTRLALKDRVRDVRDCTWKLLTSLPVLSVVSANHQVIVYILNCSVCAPLEPRQLYCPFLIHFFPPIYPLTWRSTPTRTNKCQHRMREKKRGERHTVHPYVI